MSERDRSRPPWEGPTDRTPVLLAEEAGFVRRLAGSLVADDQADDVAQEALLAALRRPPRRPGNLRPWLRAVTRNRARQDHRSRARRVARERRGASARESAAAADVVARAEVARRVAGAAHALPEPFRGTLLLRYFDGLEPSEIASRLGIPDSTVRNRLRRALDRLRARLDDHYGDRRAWSLPLALVATGTATARAGTRAGIAVTLSGALACLALLGAAFVLFRSPTSEAGGEAVRAGSSPAHGPSPPGAGGSRRPLASAGPRDTAGDTRSDRNAGAPRAPGLRLEGMVDGIVHDAPLRAPVTVRPDVLSQARSVTISAAVREDGSFRADLSSLAAAWKDVESLIVELDDPSYVRVLRVVPTSDATGAPAPPPAVFETRLALARAGIVAGRIVDARGDPIPDALVSLHDPHRDGFPAHPLDEATTGRDGGFRLRADRSTGYTVVARAPGYEVEQRPARVEVPRVQDLGAVSLAAGVTLSGRVVDPNGHGIAGAHVLATPDAPRNAFDPASQGRQARGRTREDGTFLLAGLAPGPYAVRLMALEGAAVPRSVLARGVPEARVDAPANGIELLARATLVRLRIEHPDSPGAEVALLPGDGTSYFLEPGGRLPLWLAPGTRYRCALRVAGFEERILPFDVEDRPGPQEILLDPGPLTPRASLEIRLAGAGSESIERLWYELVRADPGGEASGPSAAPPPPHTARRGLAKRRGDPFPIPDVAAGTYRLRARPGADGAGAGFHLEERTQLEARSGERTSCTVRVRPGGRLSLQAVSPEGRGLAPLVRLRDAAGEPVPIALLRRGVLSASSTGSDLDPSGPVEVTRALPPGAYELELALDGFRPHRERIRIRPEATTRVRAVLRPLERDEKGNDR